MPTCALKCDLTPSVPDYFYFKDLCEPLFYHRFATP